MRSTLLALYFLCGSAFGQSCLPSMDNATHIAGPLQSIVTANGACVRWHCAERGTGRLQTNAYCGLPSEFPKVGGRVATIIKAADPLKSLQTAGSRFTILPLSDPSLAAIVADLK